MRVTLRDRLSLLVILLLGMALRLYRLGADSFWYDETVSVYLAGSPAGELIRHTAGDIHPPGYYLLLRAWLLATGYPNGHAAPSGIGLEFMAGFFSLGCGVALIALVYLLARSLGSRATALAAAAIVALSPYNIWYSQETRMYTLAAGLGAATLYALLTGLGLLHRPAGAGLGRIAPWAAYALAGAAGLYAVYYFVFLLLGMNIWVLALLILRKIRRERFLPWLLANIVVAVLYSPWAPVAWKQATSPPVPAWRAAVELPSALRESWTALSLGQSAPEVIWPILALALLVYAAGLFSLLRLGPRARVAPARPSWDGAQPRMDGDSPIAASFLPIATFGSLGLILLSSALTSPLYHVRYVFTYSPAVYVVLGAGIVWVWRQQKWIAAAMAIVWLAGAAVTLHAFWSDPQYRSDDLRGAAAYLESKWRPGDVVLVNAGYAYPALLTYWQGPVGSLGRLTGPLPKPGTDMSLVALTTGHVDGDPNLGWGDPRSDFFAMPAAEAAEKITALFRQHPRVWHYRIYDTVSDPGAFVRSVLESEGLAIEDRVFAGQANMRVQEFVTWSGASWKADRESARYPPALELEWDSLPAEVIAGQTIYPTLLWRLSERLDSDIATSVRLVGPEGAVLSQGQDERPLGEMFTVSRWPPGYVAEQSVALPVPTGTPPGEYDVELVVYDPTTGLPKTPERPGVVGVETASALRLGRITVRPSAPEDDSRQSLSRFGPLSLVDARTPATIVTPGDAIPIELTWQALQAPGEPLVVVVQLLDSQGGVAAGLEEQPLDGRYPTQEWVEGEIVRDRHLLTVPATLSPGDYDLIVGVYRASDGQRIEARRGILGRSDRFAVKKIRVQR